MTWGKHRLPRLLIAAIICVCAVSAVCPSYASSKKPIDRTVIKYVPLSTLTGDAYPDSITVTAGSKTVTVKAKYNRAKNSAMIRHTVKVLTIPVPQWSKSFTGLRLASRYIT